MGLRTKRRKSRKPRSQAISGLQRALELAERDPEAFRAEAGRLARQVGTTVEDLYAQVRRDPRSVRRIGLDLLLQRGARLLKRELGL